jgi:hypothetical protein
MLIAARIVLPSARAKGEEELGFPQLGSSFPSTSPSGSRRTLCDAVRDRTKKTKGDG